MEMMKVNTINCYMGAGMTLYSLSYKETNTETHVPMADDTAISTGVGAPTLEGATLAVISPYSSVSKPKEIVQ
jgi:hypothetical protein